MYNANLGVGLSGGGARGIAHIGVLKAFEESGLKINHLSGTSMGAIVGVFYCAGYQAAEIEEILKKEKVHKWFGIQLFKAGLLSFKGVRKILEKYIKINDFSELKFPFYVGVSNLNLGKGEIIFKGNQLIDFVLASASVPIIVTPQEINGNVYVDGGLFYNMPTEILFGRCDKIIGSNVNPTKNMKEFDSVRSIGERVFSLTIAQNVWQSSYYCDFIIEPKKLNQYAFWDYTKIEELVKIGYDEAMKTIKRFIIPELEEESLL